MFPISPALGRFVVCALFVLPALAQVTPTPIEPALPSPAGTATNPAATAALPYASAFEGYQAFSDEKPRPWKESNATVERIGGWRAYAKEAAEPPSKDDQAPDTEPAATPKAAAAPIDPHAGHSKH